MIKPPKTFRPRKFKDPHSAVAAIREIYEANIVWLRECFEAFAGGYVPQKRITACYPYIRIQTESAQRFDSRLSYGFVPKPGIYAATVTRPDIFEHYHMEQIRLLMLNH